MDVIKFYHLKDEYGSFSNFARYPIKLKGKTWPTIAKFSDSDKNSNQD